MPPRRGSRRANVNSITHYGIMGGLAPQRNASVATMRGFRTGHANLKQRIPLGAGPGLAYMMGQNPMGRYMLSKNPQCAGGVGRMASTSSRGAYTSPSQGKPVHETISTQPGENASALTHRWNAGENLIFRILEDNFPIDEEKACDAAVGEQSTTCWQALSSIQKGAICNGMFTSLGDVGTAGAGRIGVIYSNKVNTNCAHIVNADSDTRVKLHGSPCSCPDLSYGDGFPPEWGGGCFCDGDFFDAEPDPAIDPGGAKIWVQKIIDHYGESVTFTKTQNYGFCSFKYVDNMQQARNTLLKVAIYSYFDIGGWASRWGSWNEVNYIGHNTEEVTAIFYANPYPPPQSGSYPALSDDIKQQLKLVQDKYKAITNIELPIVTVDNIITNPYVETLNIGNSAADWPDDKITNINISFTEVSL